MDRAVLVRRAIHALVALAPMYYLLPDDLPVLGVRRWVLLILFLGGLGAFEAWRRAKGVTILGLRPHEMRSIASYLWAAAGITIALWLFPRDIASVSLVGMGFVDPLAGELRQRWGDRAHVVFVSIAVYLVLALPIMMLFEYRSIGLMLALCVVGSVSAVLSEWVDTKYVDDDFLMVVVPCVLMAALAQAV